MRSVVFRWQNYTIQLVFLVIRYKYFYKQTLEASEMLALCRNGKRLLRR